MNTRKGRGPEEIRVTTYRQNSSNRRPRLLGQNGSRSRCCTDLSESTHANMRNSGHLVKPAKRDQRTGCSSSSAEASYSTRADWIASMLSCDQSRNALSGALTLRPNGVSSYSTRIGTDG
jgi:hypothetical protein